MIVLFYFFQGLLQAQPMKTWIIKIDNLNNALKSTGRGSDDWKSKEIISSQGQTGLDPKGIPACREEIIQQEVTNRINWFFK